MSIVMSPGGTDGFRAVAYDPSGAFYAAGFARDGADSAAAVAKFDADGRLVPAFGSGGITKKNVVQAGDVEVVTGIVVQSTGKIVVVATVENATTPTERSVVLVRFDGSGIVDPSFGNDGFPTASPRSSRRARSNSSAARGSRTGASWPPGTSSPRERHRGRSWRS